MLEVEEPKVKEKILPKAPKNWIFESIIVMILLMFPCGLVALIFGVKSSNNYKLGDLEKSKKRSKQAKLWNLIGVCTGIPINVFYYFFME